MMPAADTGSAGATPGQTDLNARVDAPACGRTDCLPCAPLSNGDRTMKAIALAALLVAASIGQALAWGEEGHAIVAEVAQRRLNDAARAAVTNILANASPTLKNASLASLASWADDYRPSHTETSNWHFVDIPLD